MDFFILLAGLAVYSGYGMAGLGYLLIVTLAGYLAGLLGPKHRFAAALTMGFHALALVLVKLLPVTGMTLAAPMGISYFSLKLISYNADVLRGKYPPEKNFTAYLLYITYLPGLFLGPVEKYDSFRLAAGKNRSFTWEDISAGAVRILWGLFKKLTIAARAGVLVSSVSAEPETYRGAYALFAMVLYSVQLYADFSGGIDMVLGASRMLGIRLSENFNAPYFSQSVAEFWRRWHMTLGTWLRDYVYIPLGGNRKGKIRKVLNTLVTFLVSGLWHGVEYLLWGLFNGIFVCFGEKLKTRWKFVNQAGTFFLVTLLWAFFVWPQAGTALSMIGSVFTTFNYGALAADLLNLGLNGGEWCVLIAAVAILWLYDLTREKLSAMFSSLGPAGRVAVMGALGLIVLIFGMYGIGFDAEAFIYSRF